MDIEATPLANKTPPPKTGPIDTAKEKTSINPMSSAEEIKILQLIVENQRKEIEKLKNQAKTPQPIQCLPENNSSIRILDQIEKTIEPTCPETQPGSEQQQVTTKTTTKRAHPQQTRSPQPS